MARPRTLLLAAIVLVSCASAAPAAAATNFWLKPQPLNIAHQGGEDEFPSNTLYAFRKAIGAGADMLELDVGVTKDNQIIVMHDTSVDRVTNGKGLVSTKTLKQIKQLDAAYWFKAGDNAYRHGLSPSSYRFRGIATGRKAPPKGFKASDFRVATLKEVLAAYPRTPINVEIKGRTKKETDAEYLRNAGVLAKQIKSINRRDVIVVSFKQKAVEHFHRLAPKVALAPGIDGAAQFLAGNSPGEGVVALQVPITYRLDGFRLEITKRENVMDAHKRGYAWQNWFSDEDPDSPVGWNQVIDACVDGIMTASPTALERVLKVHKRPAACNG